MQLITKTEDLTAACARLATSEFLTVDTEFMRESTFWAKLCLIQMADESEEVIIDPLADGIDLQPFFDLMTNENVHKVFHAGRQDLEIIYHMAGIIPHPIFDTQVAAMVCGFGESVSYGALVKKVTRQDVDKSSRFTDWSRRPLSDKQITYALGDVTHLRDIYHYLKEQITTSGRASWVDEEMEQLTNPQSYELNPKDAWRRLKMRVKTRRSLAVMMDLAAWRERVAQSQDVPRNRIMKDDAIYDIANQMPQSVKELSALRTVHEGFARSNRGRDVLTAVKQGLARDQDTIPPLEKGKPLPVEAGPVIDLLRVLLKSASARHGVASKLIATSDDLEKIAVNDHADVPALKGWRRELFGEDALALKHGTVSLAVQEGKIVIIRSSDPPAKSESQAVA